MADWDALADGFRYDAWATGLWLECLNRKGTGDPDRAILTHTLSASTIWLLRCQGESPAKMPEVELTPEALAAASSGWLTLLQGETDDRIIHFSRTTGEKMSLTVSEIANQVINHGTYHRGELRGLCRARGDEDFPETDRARFAFQKNSLA